MAEKQNLPHEIRLIRRFFTRIPCIKLLLVDLASKGHFYLVKLNKNLGQRLASNSVNGTQRYDLQQYTKKSFHLFMKGLWWIALNRGANKYGFTSGEWPISEGNFLFLSPPSLLTVRGYSFSLFQLDRKEINFLFA